MFLLFIYRVYRHSRKLKGATMGRKKKAVVVEDRKPLTAYKQEAPKVSLKDKLFTKLKKMFIKKAK